jgi:hypothetical protein
MITEETNTLRIFERTNVKKYMDLLKKENAGE